MRKIYQLRQVLYSMRKYVTKNGLNPKIRFCGTVKLHGTNGSVCLDENGEIQVFNKKRKLSSEQDNYGFYQFVMGRKDVFRALLPFGEGYQIFGEFAGQGIQKGVGISKLPKAFYPFWVKTRNGDIILPLFDSIPDSQIYNLHTFKTFDIEIDVLGDDEYMAGIAQQIKEMTDRVIDECPVAKELGENGPGEGIVWVAHEPEFFTFKSKGEVRTRERKRSKVEIAPEVIENITNFVNYAVNEERFKQAVDEVCGDEPLLPKHIGQMMQWMCKDIFAEESDVITTNGIDWKLASRYICDKVRHTILSGV